MIYPGTRHFDLDTFPALYFPPSSCYEGPDWLVTPAPNRIYLCGSTCERLVEHTASMMIDHFPFCKPFVEIESIYIVFELVSELLNSS